MVAEFQLHVGSVWELQLRAEQRKLCLVTSSALYQLADPGNATFASGNFCRPLSGKQPLQTLIFLESTPGPCKCQPLSAEKPPRAPSSPSSSQSTELLVRWNLCVEDRNVLPSLRPSCRDGSRVAWRFTADTRRYCWVVFDTQPCLGRVNTPKRSKKLRLKICLAYCAISSIFTIAGFS